jgi:hypothetical protein
MHPFPRSCVLFVCWSLCWAAAHELASQAGAPSGVLNVVMGLAQTRQHHSGKHAPLVMHPFPCSCALSVTHMLVVVLGSCACTGMCFGHHHLHVGMLFCGGHLGPAAIAKCLCGYHGLPHENGSCWSNLHLWQRFRAVG